MKRCPECGRDYNDDSMSFCLDDGAELLFGPASMDEPATAILSEPGAVATGFRGDEGQTTPFIKTSDQTAILRSGAEAEPRRSLGGLSEKHSFSAHRAAKPLAALIVAGLILVGGFFGYRYFTPAKQIESIAVMPFVNDSGNADVEYLSDGMTEALISSLSQLQNLNVKPRSSVFRYKGKETDSKTLAKDLNVETILNGRVVLRGQDVALFVELIDIAREKVVWSKQYTRRQNDLVTLQTDIARDVSGQLKAKLTGADEAKVTKTYTTNPEAYQLYLKGTYHRYKFTEDGYKRAIEYFQQAIEKDPNYALAYSEIAFAYNFASDWYLAPHEAMPKGKAAALKALELDNTLAGAHSSIGVIAFWYDWDWALCERALLRSMELDPTYSHQQYALYLAAMGRTDESLREIAIAQGYFPLNLSIYADYAWFYIFAGQNDKAIEKARKGLELDENYWHSRVALGIAYERKRQFPEAIAELEKANSLDNNPSIKGFLGYVYAMAGKQTEAQKVLNELKELSKQRFVPPYSIAMIYAGLNDKNQAFEWLEKAYEARSGLAYVKVEPAFNNLRDDRRYQELLKRMNLPD